MKLKRICAIALTGIFALSGLLFGVSVKGVNVSAASQNETTYQRGVGSSVNNFAEEIEYARREVDSFVLNPELPRYFSGYSCGVTSGSVTIAWYDRLLPDLIPNHTPGFQLGYKWIWSTQSVPAMSTLFDELEDCMGSNGSVGVTVSEYLSGIGIYTYGKGYMTYLDSVRTNSSTLSSSFKTSIQNGQLVALFLNGFNIVERTGIYEYDGEDVILVAEYDDAHVVTAYGYKEISYFDENDNMFRKDMYVNVFDGLHNNNYVRINSHCTLDAAWVTYVS